MVPQRTVGQTMAKHQLCTLYHYVKGAGKSLLLGFNGGVQFIKTFSDPNQTPVSFMCQEVNQRLVSRLYPQYIPSISRL